MQIKIEVNKCIIIINTQIKYFENNKIIEQKQNNRAITIIRVRKEIKH